MRSSAFMMHAERQINQTVSRELKKLERLLFKIAAEY
jgi:hypothetical protein